MAHYEKVKREAARLLGEVERLDKEVIRQKTLRCRASFHTEHATTRFDGLVGCTSTADDLATTQWSTVAPHTQLATLSEEARGVQRDGAHRVFGG